MKGFKKFINEATEEEKDVEATLKKVPKSHRELIKNYKFIWQGGNTLKGDDGHVGKIDPLKKSVTVAAPWRYPRENVLLHELAHKVWEVFITPELRKEWAKVVKKNKNRDKTENDEENFCHAYATYFAKNQVVKHYCEEWLEFINKII